MKLKSYHQYNGFVVLEFDEWSEEYNVENADSLDVLMNMRSVTNEPISSDTFEFRGEVRINDGNEDGSNMDQLLVFRRLYGLHDLRLTVKDMRERRLVMPGRLNNQHIGTVVHRLNAQLFTVEHAHHEGSYLWSYQTYTTTPSFDTAASLLVRLHDSIDYDDKLLGGAVIIFQDDVSYFMLHLLGVLTFHGTLLTGRE